MNFETTPSSNNSLYDSEDSDFDDFLNKGKPTSLSSFQTTALFILSVVLVLGVPGNALVVWITTCDMKRSVNTVWFLNLAIADLLCCLSVPFTIMEIVMGQWPLGLATCKLIPTLLLINMYASVLLLTVISIDRWLLVAKPVWCQNKRTVIKAYLACAIVWLLALILTSPSFVFRQIVVNIVEKHVCVMHYNISKDHIEKVKQFIAIFRFLIGFIIPFVVITVCYGVLVRKVSERYNKSGKTMKVVTVVIIGFFVCWFPYHIAGLIIATHSSNSDLYQNTLKIDPILVSFAIINSCINPIIYVLAGQDLKSKFRKSIRSVVKNVLAEEESQSFDSKKTKSSSETKNTDTCV
ncbi:hypothetical protein XENTR_v10021353 [Xenopus tropicalis]|uniref:C5a anaphylatoxin chemotactic receptor 1 n=1 Tax=Xenopus tropicalis TaxID=8364 RepID=F6T8Y4_XENTR|nr:C5a anaphylatoxin chemotactic receptor 1 [Xenopus tropicalis]XP_031746700.1 C5a anaphylatoxin chemotactic receptor 1 [Xenopus tropicalis]KAE8585559.1 hypothetical protein XENTR_v10021353 [Xenopus tropicalis]KAE8585560.1 hypothetical protein XENTR_v10021353 [Xenopus tropicalis]KAE8585561.1 hypothetical protein XENTR_v10021353 [Xenopus tropicalis]